MIHLRVAGEDEGGRGWLCPKEPDFTVTGGPLGSDRLSTAGCLDLGASEPIESGTFWQVTFDLRDQQADRLLGFVPGASYRLLLVTGDDHGGSVASMDTPPMNLLP